MYQDQILFLLGGVALIVFLGIVLYLFLTREKSRIFRQILQKETEALSAFSSTLYDAVTPAVTAVREHLTASTVVSDDTATVSVAAGTEFAPEVLKGHYTLLSEMGGGGMSRVFLARKDNVGNEWVVKYVQAGLGALTYEAEILKSMNHISLPKIIDIFHDASGSYLVESYIEGMGMNQVLGNMDTLHESVVLDWAQQLAQVLSYLHNVGHVYHLDLKPSNIMVTSDNKLVLIDFGISRRTGDTGAGAGATVAYAAPEQLKGKIGEKARDIVEKRFGGPLPAEHENWQHDARTDIYSFGVILFEALVGHIPTVDSMGKLRDYASAGLCDIIMKCLAVDPSARYQTTDDLLADIHQHRTQAKPVMIKTLFARKVASVSSGITMLLAILGFAVGWYTLQLQVQATMYIAPGLITVSLQQAGTVEIMRLLPNGTEERMDPSRLRWETGGDGVVQVDGNRIVGLNVGRAVLHGFYREAAVTLQVTVLEPMYGMVDISLRYATGGTVGRFAGSGARTRTDGALAGVEFVSPESMAVTASGALYLVDSGVLRRISPAGMVESIEINPPFMRPDRVRTYGNDVYILTAPWHDGYGIFYGIIRLSDGGAEGFYLGDAMFTEIRDFYVANGYIYIVERNEGIGRTRLRTISTADPTQIRTLADDLPEGANALAVTPNGQVFIANASRGELLAYYAGEVTSLAGASDSRHFIDGTAPSFYRPTHIRYDNGGLYIWDFNVLRRLEISNGLAVETTTLAGMASATYSMQLTDGGVAHEIILPHSYLTESVRFGGSVIISDPKRSVIWVIEEENAQ